MKNFILLSVFSFSLSSSAMADPQSDEAIKALKNATTKQQALYKAMFGTACVNGLKADEAKKEVEQLSKESSDALAAYEMARNAASAEISASKLKHIEGCSSAVHALAADLRNRADLLAKGVEPLNTKKVIMSNQQHLMVMFIE